MGVDLENKLLFDAPVYHLKKNLSKVVFFPVLAELLLPSASNVSRPFVCSLIKRSIKF